MRAGPAPECWSGLLAGAGIVLAIHGLMLGVRESLDGNSNEQAWAKVGFSCKTTANIS